MSFGLGQAQMEAVIDDPERQTQAACDVGRYVKLAHKAACEVAGDDLGWDYFAAIFWNIRSQWEPIEDAKLPIHPALRKMVFERDGYRCRWCGNTDDLAADHALVPESGGGPAMLDNLQTLCRSCNSRKGAS